MQALSGFSDRARVDAMKRGSGRRVCEGSVPGELVTAAVVNVEASTRVNEFF